MVLVQADVKKEDSENKEISKPVTLDDIDSRIRLLDEKTAALKAENDRTEKLLMNERMAGISGQARVEQPKVETAKEYADRIMKNQVSK
jgi:hypothetical protein